MDGLRDATRPSMDENTLLAETEALLATLDAAAFAASRASMSVDGSIANTLLVTPSPTHSSVPPSKRAGVLNQAKSATTRPVRSRVPSRDKVKEELTELRHVKAKLDAQLLLLQQKHQSGMILRNTRLQTWRTLAVRQFQMRQLAEADNAQLKAMIHACLESSDAQKFARAYGLDEVTTMNLPNYSRGPLKQPLRLVVQDTAHANVFERLANVFERLQHQLGTAYAKMDALFSENGMDQNLLQPRSYARMKTQRLGDASNSRYVELVDIRLTPFDASHFADATWRCNREWHLKDNPYEYPCPMGDDLYDTFAVNYRMTSKVFNEGESVDYFLVMRRYRETNGRCVMLFAAQCDGEMELAGATSHEIGWLVVSDAKMPSDVDSGPLPLSPTAVIQSCLHITLTGADQVGEAKVSRLRSRLTSAFEEDVVFIRQRVDSLLLQESRARNVQLHM